MDGCNMKTAEFGGLKAIDVYWKKDTFLTGIKFTDKEGKVFQEHSSVIPTDHIRVNLSESEQLVGVKV
jgi:hypothetical protein